MSTDISKQKYVYNILLDYNKKGDRYMLVNLLDSLVAISKVNVIHIMLQMVFIKKV